MTRPPDRLRIVWLFGRPYWWHTTPRGQLVLMPATWLTHQPPTPEKAT